MGSKKLGLLATKIVAGVLGLDCCGIDSGLRNRDGAGWQGSGMMG